MTSKNKNKKTSRVPTALKQEKKYKQLMHTIFFWFNQVMVCGRPVADNKLQQLGESNEFEEYYIG
jgi:hypothetical protein